MDNVIKTFNLQTITTNSKIYVNCEQLMSKVLFTKEIEKSEEYMMHSFKHDQDFISIEKCEELIKNTYQHPENYNAQKLLGINTLDMYRKKDEIKMLASIYEYFRNDYHMIYQYKFRNLSHEYVPDLLIELKAGGIIVEIDEKFHANYDQEEDKQRKTILESSGYVIINLVPNILNYIICIEKIKNAIEEYEKVYSVEINVDLLWKELNDNSIERDFFNIIGKSITSNVKYCVYMDDVAKYLGYRCSNDAIRYINEYMDTDSYVILNKEELNRTDINFAACKNGAKNNDVRGGHNKKYIFLTRFGFYNFCLLSGTKKAKQCRTWIIRVYEKYHDLLIYTRRYLLEKNAEANPAHSQQLFAMKKLADKEKYEERQNDKINRLMKELNDLQNLVMKYKNENDELKKNLERAGNELRSQKSCNEYKNKFYIDYDKIIKTSYHYIKITSAYYK